MTRRLALAAAMLTGLALGGCSHVHLPYLPHPPYPGRTELSWNSGM